MSHWGYESREGSHGDAPVILQGKSGDEVGECGSRVQVGFVILSEVQGAVVTGGFQQSVAQSICGKRNSISKIDFRLAARAQRCDD